MNRKQKIIVSVTGIFIVLLALVGITFAYFLTRIQGNTNTTSISVTTADLRLVYGDGNNTISATNVEPGWTNDGQDGRPEPKTFTVTNEGNTTVEGFKIYLEDVRNSIERKEDLIYTITCENITPGATSTACEEFEVVENDINEINPVTVELIFPSVMSVIATDTLEPGEMHTYILHVTYKNYDNIDQSEDMGKHFSAKLNIYDAKTKFLTTEIMNNTFAGINGTTYVEPKQLGILANTTKPGEAVSLENERLISYTLDDYGTSYYYRGNVEDNYVQFAGMCWRIVRIQGDGSIKLLLASELECSESNLTDRSGYATNGTRGTKGTILTGYYGYKNDPVTAATLNDYINSEADTSKNVRTLLGNWLNEKLIEEEEEMLKLDTWYIGNLSEAYNDLGELNNSPEENHFAEIVFKYSNAVRTEITKTPSLISTLSGNIGETDSNKIGLLTVDELVYAGNVYGTSNYNVYTIQNATYTSLALDGGFTLSVRDYNGTTENAYIYNSLGFIQGITVGANTGGSKGVRPVVTLKSDVTILEGGVGTLTNPYVIG